VLFLPLTNPPPEGDDLGLLPLRHERAGRGAARASAVGRAYPVRSVSVFTPESAATDLIVAPGRDRYDATAGAVNSAGWCFVAISTGLRSSDLQDPSVCGVRDPGSGPGGAVPARRLARGSEDVAGPIGAEQSLFHDTSDGAVHRGLSAFRSPTTPIRMPNHG
jgi:hypothetical protein